MATLLGVESENVRLSFNKLDTNCTCGYAGWVFAPGRSRISPLFTASFSERLAPRVAQN